MRKKTTSNLDEAVRVAHENGMSYAEFQQLESQGKARIVNGTLYIYQRRVSNEQDNY